MAHKFHHEQLYRGEALAAKLQSVRIAICGAGALGSNLADTLARQGFAKLKVIDRDRVEEHNVSTQTYGEGDVGAWKVDVLKNQLFRNVGVEIEAINKELNVKTAAKFLKDCDLVIDAFDNSVSRALLQEHSRANRIVCLHAGLFADYGEVIWDARYRVPGDDGQDVCDYPLARNLVLLTVAVTAETLLRYLATGEQQDWSITLADFAVRPLEA